MLRVRVPRGAANAVRTSGTGGTCRLGLSPLSPEVHSQECGHRRLTSTSSPLLRHLSPPILRPLSPTQSVHSLSLSSRPISIATPIPRTPLNLTTHHRSIHVPAAPRRPRPLTVLALESSADDSCAAIVTSSREILANVVIKQHHINARYGGIHPIKAQDAHAYGVPHAIRLALSQSRLALADIDAIAYTRGPGMYGCLTVCAASAKAIGAATGKPLVGVHHMQAHALTPLLTEPSPPQFPFLVLLVSGGHTQLVLASGVGRFRILVDKLDNAVGDAFDKIARALHLPSSPTSGPGAVLESYASLPPLAPYDVFPLPALPIPLLASSKPGPGGVPEVRELAFSFAGLVTATERAIRGEVDKLNGIGVERRGTRDHDESDGPGGDGRGGRGDRETEPTALNSSSVSAISVGPSDARQPLAAPDTVPRDEDQVPRLGTVPAPVPVSEAVQREISRRFQEAAVGHLVLQLRRALRRLNSGKSALDPSRSSGPNPGLGLGSGECEGECEGESEGVGVGERSERSGFRIRGLVVSGGVACNHYLRERLRSMLDEETHGVPLYYPPVELCTDNAAMIAWTAILRIQAAQRAQDDASLDSHEDQHLHQHSHPISHHQQHQHQHYLHHDAPPTQARSGNNDLGLANNNANANANDIGNVNGEPAGDGSVWRHSEDHGESEHPASVAGVLSEPFELPIRARWSLEELYDDVGVDVGVDVDDGSSRGGGGGRGADSAES